MRSAVGVQRAFRYRVFRRALVKLRAEREELGRAVLVCQRAVRMKRFRRGLAQVREQRRREEEEARLNLMKVSLTLVIGVDHYFM